MRLEMILSPRRPEVVVMRLRAIPMTLRAGRMRSADMPARLASRLLTRPELLVYRAPIVRERVPDVLFCTLLASKRRGRDSLPSTR
jgi:hypothetical protein